MKIVIDPQTFEEMMHYCILGLKDKREVSGYAQCVYDAEADVFRISNACLPKQTASSVETEIDDQDKARLMYQRRDEVMPGGMKCHWHTHPNMGVTWSGTDHALIRKLGEGEWMVFLVMNEKRQITGAYYENVEQSVLDGAYTQTVEKFIPDMPVEIGGALSEERQAELTSIYKQNSEAQTVTPFYQGRGWQSHYPNSGSTLPGKQVAPISTGIEYESYDPYGWDDDEDWNCGGWGEQGGRYYYDPTSDPMYEGLDGDDLHHVVMHQCFFDDCEWLAKEKPKFKRLWTEMLEKYGEKQLKESMGVSK